MLGPLEVVENNRPLALGGAKQRSLLAVLLLRANQAVSSDRLIDELWGGSPPATAGKIVQVYVSRLRKQLGEARLLTRASGYLLRVDPAEADAILATSPARRAVMGGRELRGWLRVPAADLPSLDAVRPWVALAVHAASTA